MAYYPDLIMFDYSMKSEAYICVQEGKVCARTRAACTLLHMFGIMGVRDNIPGHMLALCELLLFSPSHDL